MKRVESGLRFLAQGGDFADGIIAHEAKRHRCDCLVTFDRKFAQLSPTEQPRCWRRIERRIVCQMVMQVYGAGHDFLVMNGNCSTYPHADNSLNHNDFLESHAAAQQQCKIGRRIKVKH